MVCGTRQEIESSSKTRQIRRRTLIRASRKTMYIHDEETWFRSLMWLRKAVIYEGRFPRCTMADVRYRLFISCRHVQCKHGQIAAPRIRMRTTRNFVNEYGLLRAYARLCKDILFYSELLIEPWTELVTYVKKEILVIHIIELCYNPNTKVSVFIREY